MATKTLKTRVINKHEKEANWRAATGFTPLEGELIIYDPDSNYPYARFKVGDGKTNVQINENSELVLLLTYNNYRPNIANSLIVEITQDEYEAINDKIVGSINWSEESDSDDISAEEALDIILGGNI